MKKRILIVDDEEYLLLSMQRNLANVTDFEVFTTSDAGDVLRLVDENKVDVLITDLIMPGMEGLDLINKVRSNFPDIRVIVMSGAGKIHGDEYRQLVHQCGAFYSLSKPFLKDELIAAIQKVLQDDRY